jgi:hypothetical protein
MTVRDALNSALDEELARDPSVYILGEEVRVCCFAAFAAALALALAAALLFAALAFSVQSVGGQAHMQHVVWQPQARGGVDLHSGDRQCAKRRGAASGDNPPLRTTHPAL